jgi:hypothetical protein
MAMSDLPGVDLSSEDNDWDVCSNGTLSRNSQQESDTDADTGYFGDDEDEGSDFDNTISDSTSPSAS